MAPCSSRARVARSGWWLASASPGTPQHPWRLHERRGDVMPLEPGQAVRLMPWAVPRLDTSRLIAANHDVAAGIPEYSRAAAWRPADAHLIRPAGTDLPASAFACPTRNPRRVGAWWIPADSWGYGPYRRPRYRLGGAE